MLLFGYPGGSYLRLSQMQTVCEVLDNLRVLLGTLVLIQLLLQVIAIPLRLIDRNFLSAGGVPVSYTHLTLPTTRLVCRSRWSPDH